MKLSALIICLSQTACVVGPLEIYHEEGSLPKARVNVSDDCRIRGRVSSNDHNARFTCKWYINPMFDIVQR
jgi:hypothetical protein